MKLKYIFILFFLLVPIICSADWEYFYSEHKLLKNHLIIEAGKVTEESKYDYDTFITTNWYEFKSNDVNICFECLGYIGNGNSSLLLMDKDENLKIATFEISILSIKVSLENIRVIECPSKY